MVAKGLGDGGVGSGCLMDMEFQFCKVKRVLETDDGDGGMTI